MMIEEPERATLSPRISPGAEMDRKVARSPRPWLGRPAAAWGLVAVIAAAFIWYFVPASGSTNVAAADTETGQVVRAPFSDYLPLRATVAPQVTTLVGVMAGGQVEHLLVQDGAMVRQGQPLARLTNPELRLDVLSREAQIASQLGSVAGENLGIQRSRIDRTGQVAQANYDLIKAQRELAIRKQLYDQGFLAEAGVRSYTEEANYQEKRLAQLQSGNAKEMAITATQSARLDDTRMRLENNLAGVRSSLDALVIKAPASGRLLNFAIEPGQRLQAGDPAGQVDSEGAWKLTADVDEYYLGRVALGMKATLDGARLTVSKVVPAVKDGRFRVELMFEDAAPAGLNRGQTLDIRITLGSTAPALVAPVGSWLQSGSGSTVFVIDADGRQARRRAVKLGRRNPEQVEILSGLAPGEHIVTSNTASITGDILNLR